MVPRMILGGVKDELSCAKTRSASAGFAAEVSDQTLDFCSLQVAGTSHSEDNKHNELGQTKGRGRSATTPHLEGQVRRRPVYAGKVASLEAERGRHVFRCGADLRRQRAARRQAQRREARRDEEVHKGTTVDVWAIRIRTPAEGSPTEQGGRPPPTDDRVASKNSKYEHNCPREAVIW